MKRWIALACALTVAWPLAVLAQPREVVIGLIYPMSGPQAQGGTDAKPAFEIAAEIVNGTVDIPLPFYQALKGMPGLKGAKVRLVWADHQGKPALGQAEAERLITQEKIHALVCCWHSSVTAVASQVAERHGIPHLLRRPGLGVEHPRRLLRPDLPRPRRVLRHRGLHLDGPRARTGAVTVAGHARRRRAGPAQAAETRQNVAIARSTRARKALRLASVAVFMS